MSKFPNGSQRNGGESSSTVMCPSSQAEDALWTTVIEPHCPWYRIDFAGLWQHRDLIFLFVKRDFVAVYKQTILGPLWFFLTPLFTTVVFTIVFGRIARIPTDGIPPFLFYLSGTVCWAYFSGCLLETSNTFVSNAHILGKVYFPRLAIPISVVISHVLKFAIQFTLFLCFFGYFYANGASVTLSLWAMVLPVVLIQMALLSLSCGILVSSMTTKYRDLNQVVNFGVQLWMYATPIVYPLSQVPELYRNWYAMNPMVAVVETFRLGFFGGSTLEPCHVMISVLVTLALFACGLVMFSRVERTFMDTI